MFIGCFTTADDEGRRKATPASIRADIFPLDDIPLADVGKLRDEVAASGLIRVYSGREPGQSGPDSGPILDIPNWARFQKPKYVKKSIFPPYSASLGQTGPEAGLKPGENSPEPGHGLGRVGMGRDGLDRDGLTPPPIPRPPSRPPSLPEEITDEQWNAFREHRRKKRSPLTARAEELQAVQLAKIKAEGLSPVEALDCAILTGWLAVKARLWIERYPKSTPGEEF